MKMSFHKWDMSEAFHLSQFLDEPLNGIVKLFYLHMILCIRSIGGVFHQCAFWCAPKDLFSHNISVLSTYNLGWPLRVHVFGVSLIHNGMALLSGILHIDIFPSSTLAFVPT